MQIVFCVFRLGLSNFTEVLKLVFSLLGRTRVSFVYEAKRLKTPCDSDAETVSLFLRPKPTRSFCFHFSWLFIEIARKSINTFLHTNKYTLGLLLARWKGVAAAITLYAKERAVRQWWRAESRHVPGTFYLALVVLFTCKFRDMTSGRHGLQMFLFNVKWCCNVATARIEKINPQNWRIPYLL